MCGYTLPRKISTEEWSPVHPNPHLCEGVLDLWRINLQRGGHSVRELSELVTEDEQARAKTFRFNGDARRFIVRRAVLRQLLDRNRCGRSSEIRFSYTPRGKPAIHGPQMDSPKSFSTSYRDECAILAFSRTGGVGVDLESARDFPLLDEVAVTFMTADELQSFHAAHSDELLFLTLNPDV